MKKTSMVKLGLTSAVAAALAGCGRSEASRCVDYTDRVVDERYCKDMEQNRSRGFSTGYYPYRWYYGGLGYALGSRAAGGGYAPSSTGSGTVRGGFGSTAHGGSGGGE
jgi:hypothetical protein